MTKQIFGQRLRTMRKQADLTQETLAKKCGIPQSHLSKLELRSGYPDVSTLLKLAKGLGVTVGELL